MKPITVAIQLSSTKELQDTVWIPSHIAQQQQLSNYTNVYVGKQKAKAQVAVFESKEDTVYFSSSLFTMLRLPINSLSLQIKIINEEIFFGPVIAVVTSLSKEGAIPPSLSDFCKEMHDYCREIGGLFFVTTFKHWHSQECFGYVMKDGDFEYDHVPLPNVIHNRVHSRKKENGAAFEKFEEDILSLGIPFFNQHFLDKWFVHEHLSQYEHLTPFLPMTYYLKNKEDLMNALSAHRSLFLKPINGSQGKKIFKVQERSGTYLVDSAETGEREIYDNFTKLYKSLYPKFKKRNYLLQETLSLKEIDNRPFDFRILCHRKQEDKWGITSMVARVSKESGFVSNLSQGGDLMPIKDLLQTFYSHREMKHLLELLRELSLEICHCLCAQNEGLYGEFGLDLALDEDGSLWLIEVNTKPSKRFFLTENGQTRPSTKALVRYCCRLSGFE